MSVVPPTVPVLVPPVRENTTVDPPVVRLFPAASLACKVRVTLDPEATVALETEIKEVAVAMVPGVTVTVGKVVVTAVPPTVAVIVVPVPTRTPVKTAV